MSLERTGIAAIKASLLLRIGGATLFVTVSSSLMAAAGDAEWKKVDVALTAIKQQNEIATIYDIHSIFAMWLVNQKGMVIDTAARGGLEEKAARLLKE